MAKKKNFSFEKRQKELAKKKKKEEKLKRKEEKKNNPDGLELENTVDPETGEPVSDDGSAVAADDTDDNVKSEPASGTQSN